MTVTLNVFVPFMKDKIIDNMESNLIATYKCHLSHIFELQFLSNCLNHSSILCFCTRSWHNTMFLAFPRSQVTSNGNKIFERRSFIRRRSCPINI